MRPNTHTGSALSWQAGVFAAATLAAILLAGCHRGKKYTWADRFPQDDCNPRTAKAKEELGGCPKLTDPQRPTPQEKQKFVTYMNRKNSIEGTILLGSYYPPGCWNWSVNPNTRDIDSGPTGKKNCGQNLEKKLRNFSVP
jgi:hypothetical protein